MPLLFAPPISIAEDKSASALFRRLGVGEEEFVVLHLLPNDVELFVEVREVSLQSFDRFVAERSGVPYRFKVRNSEAGQLRPLIVNTNEGKLKIEKVWWRCGHPEGFRFICSRNGMNFEMTIDGLNSSISSYRPPSWLRRFWNYLCSPA